MHQYNSDYIHHQKGLSSALIRELVFGMEDGMVSTLGAITGIVTSTQNHFFVILSGSVIISVESISMAVGSYLSNKSEQAIDERIIEEEREEIQKYPDEEKKEMADLFIKDGWSSQLAIIMAEETGKNKNLMLKEMAYRELKLIPENHESAVKKAVIMGTSYVAGGLVPLTPFFFFSVNIALLVSIFCTVSSLFLLGMYTTQYSKRRWWKAGLEMMGLATAAALVGYGVGQVVNFLNFQIRLPTN